MYPNIMLSLENFIFSLVKINKLINPPYVKDIMPNEILIRDEVSGSYLNITAKNVRSTPHIIEILNDCELVVFLL